MKFFLVILALVGTRTLYVVNAEQYVFDGITPQAVESPQNNVFTVQPPPGMEFEYKQEIEKLLINATVTYLGTGLKYYNGELLNICDNQEANSWAADVVKLFKFLLVPPKRRGSPTCPIQPSHGKIEEFYAMKWITSVDDTLGAGDYQYSYTAQTDKGTVILTSMIVTMTLN